MQRELKFRAWDGEKIVMVNDIVFTDGKAKGYWKENSAYESSEVLMQFTGLKDKNGKEIYEGDYVMCNTTGKIKWPSQGVVEYILSYFAINTGKNEDDEILYTHFWSNENFEILGNIYEKVQPL